MGIVRIEQVIVQTYHLAAHDVIALTFKAGQYVADMACPHAIGFEQDQ